MNFEKGAEFVWKHARLLERRVFEYYFNGGSPDRIVDVLKTYQNQDGGFGHALEPDVRAPESQPLYAEFALRTLYDCGIRAPEPATQACEYISRHADLTKGIPTLFSTSRHYPRAVHWNSPMSEEPSFHRLASLIGLLAWQGVKHPWLDEAIEVCLEHIGSQTYEDSHTIQNAFCLLESLPNSSKVDTLYDKLSGELFKARFFCLEVPVRQYGLTPHDFAPTPNSYCRRLFSTEQMEGHLEELATKQQEDGGWPIQWEPPGETAKLEWRAHVTVKALHILHAYRVQ